MSMNQLQTVSDFAVGTGRFKYSNFSLAFLFRLLELRAIDLYIDSSLKIAFATDLF